MTAILPPGLINTTAAVDQNVFGNIDTFAENTDTLRQFWRREWTRRYMDAHSR